LADVKAQLDLLGNFITIKKEEVKSVRPPVEKMTNRKEEG